MNSTEPLGSALFMLCIGLCGVVFGMVVLYVAGAWVLYIIIGVYERSNRHADRRQQNLDRDYGSQVGYASQDKINRIIEKYRGLHR